MGVGDDKLHPGKPSRFQRTQKLGPERLVLGVTNVETEKLPATVRGNSDGDDNSLRDDAVVDAGFALGGIKEHIRVVKRRKAAVAELGHLLI